MRSVGEDAPGAAAWNGNAMLNSCSSCVQSAAVMPSVHPPAAAYCHPPQTSGSPSSGLEHQGNIVLFNHEFPNHSLKLNQMPILLTQHNTLITRFVNRSNQARFLSLSCRDNQWFVK